MEERRKPDDNNLIENYVREVIEQRSLTMEDGRERGVKKPSKEDTKTPPVRSGPDDGDMLG